MKENSENECFLAPSAVITGEVQLEKQVSVWHNVTLRGDTAKIVIGEKSNVQDNVCVHAGDGCPVCVGKGVTIGHGAIIHGCTIEDNTIIGMGAIVLNGAHVGKNCLIGAGTLVLQNMDIPSGSLVIGNPAKVQRSLTLAEIEKNKKNALHYIEAGKEQLQNRNIEHTFRNTL